MADLNFEKLFSLIKRFTLLNHLKEDYILSILPYFEETTLKAGEILFYQGANSDNLFCLIDGKLISSLQSPNERKKLLAWSIPGKLLEN